MSHSISIPSSLHTLCHHLLSHLIFCFPTDHIQSLPIILIYITSSLIRSQGHWADGGVLDGTVVHAVSFTTTSIYWSIYQVSCFAHSHVLLVESGDSRVILECIICLRSIFSSLLAFHYAHFYLVPPLFLIFYFSHQSLHILLLLLSSHSQHILLSLLFYHIFGDISFSIWPTILFAHWYVIIFL